MLYTCKAGAQTYQQRWAPRHKNQNKKTKGSNINNEKLYGWNDAINTDMKTFGAES